MQSKSAVLLGGCVAALILWTLPGTASETISYSYDANGRLVRSVASGGPNNALVTATCFDRAGNRTAYLSGTGSPDACPAIAPTPTPSPAPTPGPIPTPSPTPTSAGNQPPVASSDSFSARCYTGGAVNLTANDTDPENNLPLSLVAVSLVSDPAHSETTVSISDASTVIVSMGAKGSSTFSYTVADSLGATSTGTLTAVSTGTLAQCGGGGTQATTPGGSG